MSRHDPLHVPLWELWLLGALLCFLLLASLPSGDLSSETANLVGPVGLAAILLSGGAAALHRNPIALWTGLFWMRLSTAVYFGLGSVATRVMNEESIAELYSFFEATPAQLGKINLLSAAASLVVLLSVRVASIVWPKKAAAPRAENARVLLVAGLAFAFVGYAVKYFLVLPLEMGALGEIVLPGMIGQLSWFAPIALFLLSFWSARHAPRLLPWLVLLTALDCFAGTLRFSKTDALLPLMMFALGWLQARMTWPRAALAAVAMVAAFHLIQPLTGYGRAQLTDRYDTLRAASFGERLAIVGDYLRDGPDMSDGQLQSSLMRIAYHVSAAPAVAAYDAGEPGTSLSAIPSVFVPRFLWPNKPSFEMGRDYTIMVIGLETSSTWMGYFVESYWNLGWAGVPVVMVPFGLVLFATGRYAAWVIENGQWLHFPSVFLGMWMGVRTDGVIATDIVASLWLMLLYARLAWGGSRLLEEIFRRPKQDIRTALPA